MKFNAEPSLGIQEINEQHETLLQKLSALEDAFGSGHGWQETRSTLVELTALVRTHFDFEEALMRMYGYPDLEEHRRDHLGILSELEKIESRPPTETTERKVMELLRDYFVRHMQQLDRDYAEYILRGAQVIKTAQYVSTAG